MSPGVAVRSTSPRRRAGLVLEATATAVSLILLGWLLVWFLHFRVGQPQIHALFVRAHELGVLYQENDVRSLIGDADDPKLTPRSLEGALVSRVERSSAPSLVYVSAPVVVVGPDARVRGSIQDDTKGPTIVELVRTVGEKAGGDVLLALDCAQVGSDRELAIFGNSPYQGLAEALGELKPRHQLAVILSCQPGEMSLVHHGAGRSLFAAALDHALRESRGPTIGVQELYDQVHNLVVNAAATDLKASQTPRLIMVGGAEGDRAASPRFRIGVPRSRANLPAKTEEPAVAQAKEAPKTEEPAKESAAAPASASDSPSLKLRKELVAEWAKFDGLWDNRGKADAAVVAPLELRRYEAALDQAERLVRQALRDLLPASISLANEALEKVRSSGKELADRLASPRPTPGVPFQPIAEAQWGEVDGLIRKLTRPADGKVAEENPTALAVELERAFATNSEKGGGFPSTHLELQLALWARVYLKNFPEPGGSRAFQADDGKVYQLLLKATRARGAAERALAVVELGGLDWIRSGIEAGDRDRRAVQDAIFDPRLGSNGQESADLSGKLDDRIRAYQGQYETAHALAQFEHEGRVEVARALHDLPGLGDRLVRSQPERRGVPTELEAAVKATVDLMAKLGEAPPASTKEASRPTVDDVRDRTAVLGGILKALRDRMQALEQAADLKKLAIEERFRACPPRLKAREREAALRQWVEDHPLGGINWVGSAPKANVAGASRGFWNEAFGLAALDATLRARFAGGAVANEAEQAGKDEGQVVPLWREAVGPDDPASEAGAARTDAWIKLLSRIGEHARRAASELGEKTPGNQDGRRTPALWAVGFRRALEVAGLDSRSWSAADPFTRELLTFHASRLRDDYVLKPRLDGLDDPSIAARSNPFQPRFDRLEGSIAATSELDVPVQFSDSRNLQSPRTAILEVRLTESPSPKEKDAPSFTLKDKLAPNAEGRATQLVAVGPGGDGGRVFRLVRQGGGVNKAERLDLECKSFFSGLVAEDPRAGRGEVAVQRPQGRQFKIELAPNEEYLRSRGYAADEIKRIQKHYKANNQSHKRYAWLGQPFHYSVEVERLQAEGPARVWVKVVMVASKAPGDQDRPINGKTSPQPLDVDRKIGSIGQLADTTYVHQDDVPRSDDKGRLTLKVLLFEEAAARESFEEEEFEVRSARMFDCLSFGKGEVDATKRDVLVGEERFHRIYQVIVTRDGPGKDLVSEPIRPDELQVVLETRGLQNNPKPPKTRDSLALWPDIAKDGNTMFRSGLDVGDEPVSYWIERLGFNGAETQADKSIKDHHPYRRP